MHSLGDVLPRFAEGIRPRTRPWVTPEGATTEEIVAQVRKCPSGALSYIMNEEAG